MIYNRLKVLKGLLDGSLGDIATKSDLKDTLSTLKTDMVKGIVGAISFNQLGTIGIMVTVAELIIKSK